MDMELPQDLHFMLNKTWNVIAPIDNFGLDNKGSWWIVENGDLFH